MASTAMILWSPVMSDCASAGYCPMIASIPAVSLAGPAAAPAAASTEASASARASLAASSAFFPPVGSPRARSRPLSSATVPAAIVAPTE